MPDKKLMQFRREYLAGELLEEDLLGDPHLQFTEWLDDAIHSGVDDPTAMALATADLSGKPAVRTVLLKEAREGGLIFFSNYESRKGREIENNPRASVMFFWPGLDRQLIIEGHIEKIPAEESDDFFNTRPLESRMASIISPQSVEIPDRDFLDTNFDAYQAKHHAGNILRPAYWGGYILIPESYEFWQGRENRLNDRIQFIRKDGNWEIKRLAP
jgi:pyridoxamine 5'-phosphate oxidase